jgi:ribosome-associated translation inhibitor RaiA
MILTVTAKHCHISREVYAKIRQHITRIQKSLPHMGDDRIVCRLVAAKTNDSFFPRRGRSYTHGSRTQEKPSRAYFETSLALRLGSTGLYARVKGQTMDECVDGVFTRIGLQIHKFKDVHFSNQSQYPNHETVRKGDHYGSD